jgi:hypothetical protein
MKVGFFRHVRDIKIQGKKLGSVLRHPEHQPAKGELYQKKCTTILCSQAQWNQKRFSFTNLSLQNGLPDLLNIGLNIGIGNERKQLYHKGIEVQRVADNLLLIVNPSQLILLLWSYSTLTI